MNVTKLTAAVALSVVALSSHARDLEQEGRSEWKPQKIAEMSPTTYKMASKLAQCSVAYEKDSLSTKNSDWRQFTAKTSKYSFELLEMFAADKQEIHGLIRSSQLLITEQSLPGIIAECNGMFLDSSKSKI
jgi:hypothetical protein